MKIYIASSWKNQHAVQMMTALLRERGHEVLSFVENNHGENDSWQKQDNGKPMPFEEWVWSERGEKSFKYDTDGATQAHCVLYIGPSGQDAWAEVGAAWAAKRPIIGLHAKGDGIGLMRRMVTAWCSTYYEALEQIQVVAEAYGLAS